METDYASQIYSLELTKTIVEDEIAQRVQRPIFADNFEDTIWDLNKNLEVKTKCALSILPKLRCFVFLL